VLPVTFSCFHNIILQFLLHIFLFSRKLLDWIRVDRISVYCQICHSEYAGKNIRIVEQGL